MREQDLRQFPGSPRLLLHQGAGRTGRHISSLTGASDWRRALVDRAGAAVVGAVGSRRLKPAERWAWPDCTCDELAEALRNELPGLRILGAAVPRQHGRRRLSVLARAAGTLTVIKLGVDEADGSLPAEAAVLELLRGNPLPGIATPHVLASGLLRDLPAASAACGRRNRVHCDHIGGDGFAARRNRCSAPHILLRPRHSAGITSPVAVDR